MNPHWNYHDEAGASPLPLFFEGVGALRQFDVPGVRTTSESPVEGITKVMKGLRDLSLWLVEVFQNAGATRLELQQKDQTTVLADAGLRHLAQGLCGLPLKQLTTDDEVCDAICQVYGKDEGGHNLLLLRDFADTMAKYYTKLAGPI